MDNALLLVHGAPQPSASPTAPNSDLYCRLWPSQCDLGVNCPANAQSEVARYIETFKAYENRSAEVIQGRVESDYAARLSSSLTAVRLVNKTDVATLANAFGSLKGIIQVCSAARHPLNRFFLVSRALLPGASCGASDVPRFRRRQGQAASRGFPAALPCAAKTCH
jgi:hypothetical protein